MLQRLECHVPVVETHDNINAMEQACYDRHHT